MTLPGLAQDAVVISRPAGSSDTEGNAVGALSVVASTRGTWGSPTSRDIAAFAEQIDAVLAIAYATNIQQGDLVAVRSAQYEVAHVRPLKTHKRCFLRMR